MKTLSLFVLVLFVFTGSCFAVGAGFGMRSIAMGGTGIATANDYTAAYFNPAGLQNGAENFEMHLSAGGATQGITDFMEAVSKGDTFITDNFDKDVRFGGSLNGALGFSVRRIGLGVFASGVTSFNKPANALSYNILANMEESIPLTLGSSFSTPGLPLASMSVGVNLKALGEQIFYTNVVQTSIATGKGDSMMSTGSGFGFDIGAQAKVTPLITVGAVIRNLSASLSRTIKTKTISVESDGTISDLGEGEEKESINPASQVGIGVGVVIPITGTLLAADIENYSAPDPEDFTTSKTFNDLHIGIEQGVLFNAVMLRMGYYNDGPNEDSYYTYGLGIYLGPLNLGLAAANSQKDMNNSLAMAQLGLAF